MPTLSAKVDYDIISVELTDIARTVSHGDIEGVRDFQSNGIEASVTVTDEHCTATRELFAKLLGISADCVTVHP